MFVLPTRFPAAYCTTTCFSSDNTAPSAASTIATVDCFRGATFAPTMTNNASDTEYTTSLRASNANISSPAPRVTSPSASRAANRTSPAAGNTHNQRNHSTSVDDRGGASDEVMRQGSWVRGVRMTEESAPTQLTTDN
jgi:hypothetical protein